MVTRNSTGPSGSTSEQFRARSLPAPPAVSPDGATVVIGSNAGELGRADCPGGLDRVEVGRDDAWSMALTGRDPAFSPDGRFLAYARASDDCSPPDALAVRELATGEERIWPVAEVGADSVASPSWAGDSRQLAFVLVDPNGSGTYPWVIDTTTAAGFGDAVRQEQRDGVGWHGYLGATRDFLGYRVPGTTEARTGAVIAFDPATGETTQTLFETERDVSSLSADGTGAHILAVVTPPAGGAAVLMRWSEGDAGPTRLAEGIVAASWLPDAVPAEPRDGGASADGQQRYEVSALVVEYQGGGAKLCLGVVATTAPPGCGNVPVANWDWDDVDGEQSSGPRRGGAYRAIGTYDSVAFTLRERPIPSVPDGAEPEEPLVSPCPVPAGGWSSPEPACAVDPAAAMGTAQNVATFARVWITPVDPSEASGNPAPATVLNAAFTDDLAGAEAMLAEHWGGPLCVVRYERSIFELTEIQEDLFAFIGGLGVQLVSMGVNEAEGVVTLKVVRLDDVAAASAHLQPVP